MPDVNNRDALERKLAEELGKLGATQLRSLTKALGDPPDVKNIPAEWWAQYGEQLRGVLQAYLQDVYLQQAHTMGAAVNIAPNWTLINKGAAEWARRYAGDKVKGITDTTKNTLRDIIARSYEENVTLGETTDSIGKLFGVDRAAVIATTEITNAAAEAEVATQREAAADGINMVPTWMTREDELVCTAICEPLNGVVGELIDGTWQFLNPVDGEYYGIPAAHPWCRCGLSWDIVEVTQ